MTEKVSAVGYFDRMACLYSEWPMPVAGDILGHRLASVDKIISRRVFFRVHSDLASFGSI